MDDVLCNYLATFQKMKEQQPDIQDLAATVFPSSAEAELWLNTPLNVLSGDTPVSRLHTDHGVKEVADVLRKIERGEFV